MKRILMFLLAFCFVFAFAGCGKENNENAPSVDLEYYAKLGQIPDCKYKLGQDIYELDKELNAEGEKVVSDGGEYVYNVTEGEKTVRMDNGEFIYYYEKDKKDRGISYIVALNGAYGFENGTSLIDVEKALKGYEFTSEDVTEDNVFFLSGISGGEVRKYSFDNKVIMFVFNDSSLSAVTIYDTENWTE